MPSLAEKRQTFRQLHEQGCFVIPNPWDAGSARYLQSLGFKALASTSSGYAWSQACSDNGITREQSLASLRCLVDACDLPVSADFENGFGADPQAVFDSVALALDTGIAGLSIEDSTGDAAAPLYSVDRAVERLHAARASVDTHAPDALLMARAENFVVGHNDLDDAIARLQAYAEAGADVLYVPGIKDEADIRRVVQAVAPKPVNLLIGSNSALTLARAAELGVRRISVGGALARAAWGGFMQAAQRLAEGQFDGFGQAASGAELDAFFGALARQR